MLDVAVVGAGPAGGRTAWLLARAGHKVTLYEEHPVVGEPCQCAGLISPRVFEELGYDQPVLNSLKGAVVHGPSGYSFCFSAARPRALAIDRPALDRSIVRQAVEAGAELHTGCRVTDCHWSGDQVSFEVKAGNGRRREQARMIVGADGPSGRVARRMGITHTPELLTACGTTVSGWQVDDPRVNIIVGNRIAPGFFGWIVPTGDGCARVGLAQTPGHGPVRENFNRLVSRPPFRDLLGGCEVDKITGGTIPLGLNPRAFNDGVVLVGDAAGMAKPTSGGGIFTGLVSARLAAETIVEALESGLPTVRALSRYQQRLNRTIGRELKQGGRLRRAFLKLNDAKLEELLRLIGDPTVLSVIERFGDIDYTSRVATAVLKQKPQLLKFAPLLLKPFV